METNWPTVKLEEVLSLSRESVEIDPLRTYKQITVRLHHKGVVLREEKIGQRIKSKQYLAKEGQFIISRIDARNGAMGLVPQELDGAIVTNDFLLYEINEKNLFPKYFDFLASTKSFVWQCIKASKGTTNRVRLKPEKFLEIEISLPLLEEQKRIVARIESMMARIEEARRLRVEAVIEVEKTIKSILRKIFLNDGWITDKLGNLCDTTSGGTPSRERPDFFNGEIPWLKSGELNDVLIVDSEERITEEGLQNSNAKIFTKGTLLIALYGATTGKTGILGVDAATNQAICAIFPNKNIIGRDYLHWFLRFKRDDYLFKSFGGAQPNISQKLLKETKIPILPLPEQRRIVAYLNSLQAKMDELKRLQAETEKEIEELVPSILDRAFKGEL
jgi:type I restriction enzyme S subunit